MAQIPTELQVNVTTKLIGDDRTVARKLLGSRKIWVAAATIAGNLLATFLPADKVGPIITAITTIGGIVVAAIAYEDGQKANAPGGIECPPKSEITTPKSSAGLFLAALVIPALALVGCATPTPSYTAADRATYDAIAPEYSAYVAGDPSLSADQKARRERTVTTWRKRVEAEEATTRPAR